jgi:hypothetical protein
VRLPVGESPAGPRVDRLASLLLVGLAGFFVWILVQVDPDDRGHGTHEQLGMPPCDWPLVHGKPCPTCGVTTAAAHLVQFEPLAAVATQPFGAFLAALGLGVAGLAAWSLLRRESFVARFAYLPYGKVFGGGLLLFLASWAYTWLTWPERGAP